MDASTVEEKQAKDYTEAVDAAFALLGIAIDKIPHPAAKAAAKALPALGAVAHHVAENAPKVAPLVDPLTTKVKDKLPDAFDTVANAKDKAAGTIDDINKKVKDSKSRKEQEKARRKARHALLSNAGTKVSVRRFLEDRETYLSLDGNEGYMSISGAYAILRFKKGLKNDSFEDYDDIFVNHSSDVGQSVFDDCTGRGNCNVYADLKYGQDLQLLIFPCPEEKSGELARNLAVALDADCSYNADRSA